MITDVTRHALTALALSVVVIFGASACLDSPAQISDAAALKAGNTALDGIRLPTGWTVSAQAQSGRYKGALYWRRDYKTHGTAKVATQSFDRAATAAGWKRDSSCVNSSGAKCYTYDKKGFHLFPTETDVPCSDGTDGCVDIMLNMSPNYLQPITAD